MNDPQIPIDPRVTKGCVALSERGFLFIPLIRFYRPGDAQGQAGGWRGFGFNGESIQANIAEFVSANVNEYIMETYGGITLEERLQEENKNTDNVLNN